MQIIAFASCLADAQDEDWTANLSEDSWPLLADNDRTSKAEEARETVLSTVTGEPYNPIR